MLGATLALWQCSGSGSSSSTLPPGQSGTATVRFIDGAPQLETVINGVPTGIGNAYLQDNGETVAFSFSYGTMTTFTNVRAGVHSLVARDDLGYAVGPLKSSSLSAGQKYTLIVVGSYPHYSVLTFQEPAPNGKPMLSLYEASPNVPQAAFGSFDAASRSQFKQLGTGTFGTVTTVSVGTKVSNFGGYVGPANSPYGLQTPAQLNAYDRHNELPFHAISRLSLFLFDSDPSSSTGPVFGSLDK